jgi:hypothetical protein
VSVYFCVSEARDELFRGPLLCDRVATSHFSPPPSVVIGGGTRSSWHFTVSTGWYRASHTSELPTFWKKFHLNAFLRRMIAQLRLLVLYITTWRLCLRVGYHHLMTLSSCWVSPPDDCLRVGYHHLMTLSSCWMSPPDDCLRVCITTWWLCFVLGITTCWPCLGVCITTWWLRLRVGLINETFNHSDWLMGWLLIN